MTFASDSLGVLPRHHEHRVALLRRVADERVLGLQVEDVVLVDAGRNEQEGTRVDLGRQRLVLDQLEQPVLVDDRALAGRDVPADVERRLVGLRDLAALQVGQQVPEAGLQALAAGLEQRLLRLRVGRQEVRRRGRLDPLLHGELDALLGLAIHLDRVGHLVQELGVEQVRAGIQRRERILLPRRVGEARVLDRLARLVGMLEERRPHRAHALQVVLLQVEQALRRQRHHRVRGALARRREPGQRKPERLRSVVRLRLGLVLPLLASADRTRPRARRRAQRPRAGSTGASLDCATALGFARRAAGAAALRDRGDRPAVLRVAISIPPWVSRSSGPARLPPDSPRPDAGGQTGLPSGRLMPVTSASIHAGSIQTSAAWRPVTRSRRKL